MSSFFITKWQGFLLCLLLTVPYEFFYFQYFGSNLYTIHLMALFGFGVILHFFHIIEPAERAELVFNGKATGLCWEDGYCFTPSLLPILHYFGIYLLWSLKKPRSFYGVEERNVYVDHFQDQRLPQYRVNVETSFFTATASRVFNNILCWFIGVEKGKEELLFQRVGFRVMLAAVILGWGANAFYGNTDTNYDDSKKHSISAHAPMNTITVPKVPKEGHVIIYTSLKVGKPPTMPLPEDFVVQPLGDKQLYIEVENDPRKYFLFHETDNGELHTFFITESSCVVIPPGRAALVSSVYPPLYVVNMKNRAKYALDPEKIRFDKKIFYFLWKKPMRLDETSWKYLYDRWNEVSTEKHGLKVEALPTAELLPSSKKFGGLVCF